MSQHTIDVTLYAIQAYGFLMPRAQPFTLGELAQAIRSTYDSAQARTAEVLTILDSAPHRVASFI